MEFEALRAPVSPVLKRGQHVPSFPRTPFLASRDLPSLRSGPVSFDEADTSCTIELPASLRPNGARDHPGMPFGFRSD